MALRLAHRGDWRRAPENTLAAFLAAIAVPGCDGIELDVRAAADGVPVVIHDETLKRVQGVDARVDELSAEALERHGIPSLADVVAAVPRRAFLDVELKGFPGRGAVDVLTAGRGPGLERAVISSFDPDALERVGRLAPSWPRWLNAMDLSDATIGLAIDLGCRGISVEWRAIEPKALARVRAAEFDLAAWTVRNRPTYGRLERLGVNAICAEGPALDGRGRR
jgi:glycerophosphoryl diester phosphodiesterase